MEGIENDQWHAQTTLHILLAALWLGLKRLYISYTQESYPIHKEHIWMCIAQGLLKLTWGLNTKSDWIVIQTNWKDWFITSM